MINKTKNEVDARKARLMDCLKSIAAAARIAMAAFKMPVAKTPQNILCDGARAQAIKQELVWQGKSVRLMEKIQPYDPRGYACGDYVLEVELADAMFFKMRGDQLMLIP